MILKDNTKWDAAKEKLQTINNITIVEEGQPRAMRETKKLNTKRIIYSEITERENEIISILDKNNASLPYVYVVAKDDKYWYFYDFQVPPTNKFIIEIYTLPFVDDDNNSMLSGQIPKEAGATGYFSKCKRTFGTVTVSGVPYPYFLAGVAASSVVVGWLVTGVVAYYTTVQSTGIIETPLNVMKSILEAGKYGNTNFPEVQKFLGFGQSFFERIGISTSFDPGVMTKVWNTIKVALLTFFGPIALPVTMTVYGTPSSLLTKIAAMYVWNYVATPITALGNFINNIPDEKDKKRWSKTVKQFYEWFIAIVEFLPCQFAVALYNLFNDEAQIAWRATNSGI